MVRSSLMRVLLLALSLSLLWGGRAGAETILVFAAASTSDAVQAIGHEFTEATGDQVQFSFGASSTLARQIAAGAPADVFLSADLDKMAALVRSGQVQPAEEHALVSNQLVVVAPRDSRVQITTPADLTTLRRLAVGDPLSVPVGVYARRWLESLGLYGAVAPHIIPTLDVRAALSAAEAGHVDGAIVYRTDALISQRVKIIYSVPTEKTKIIYPVACVAPCKKAAARRFVTFLEGKEAKTIFERYGFIPLSK